MKGAPPRIYIYIFSLWIHVALLVDSHVLASDTDVRQRPHRRYITKFIYYRAVLPVTKMGLKGQTFAALTFKGVRSVVDFGAAVTGF